MYKKLLRSITAVTFLVAFWSVLRLGGLTLFDWAMSFVVAASLLYRNKQHSIRLSHFRWPIMGLVLFVVAGILSIMRSSDTMDHIEKVSILLIALFIMLLFSYQIASKNILSFTEVLSLLVISGTISSVVCILQGKFGILVSLTPDTLYDDASLNRFTGLTEHPIEAGTLSAYSCVIATGLAVQTRKWFIFFPLAVINLIAMKFSASLTAVFAIATGIGAFALFSRSYFILVAMGAIAALMVGVALTSNTLGPLASRLSMLGQQQGNYLTLQYREQQWSKTVSLIDSNTILFGNGYSHEDLPDGMDIHNGILAAIFHFGILGLLSQFCLIWFFVSRLFGDSSRVLRGILLGCVVVFASGYLTGPPFSRRSLWIPVFMMAAYLPEHMKKKQDNASALLKNMNTLPKRLASE